MDNLKFNFIKMAIEHHVLNFGEFTLKSGRISPYFFNIGLFYHGSTLKKLGYFYAQTLIKNQIKFNNLFGPAYKGFSLATATAIALANDEIDCSVTFNRKEPKDHGEKGILIGAPIKDKQTIIIDDVISAGTAFREAQKLINDAGGNIVGVIIALDRCERGLTNMSGLTEIANQNIHVMSLITVFDLIEYLSSLGELQHVNKIHNYLSEYGQSI